ncbi:MAG: hypothetical protein ACI9C1_002509 [Candidatus Aldehydirespiratoraceae bacterium]|jgi:uncharacterized protein (TIGR03086 family)
MTLDPIDAYQRAAALFGETIVVLGDAEWELTTGDDWTVVSTVAWVVVGDSHIATAAEGGPLESVGDFDAAVLGTAPVAAWRGTAVAAINSLRVPGALFRRVQHPDGELAVADLVGQRVSENLVRAWDIGRAVERPVVIPEDLADWCLDFWAGHAEAVLAGGVLADSPVAPPADATAAERLLALTGRTP